MARGRQDHAIAVAFNQEAHSPIRDHRRNQLPGFALRLCAIQIAIAEPIIDRENQHGEPPRFPRRDIFEPHDANSNDLAIGVVEIAQQVHIREPAGRILRGPVEICRKLRRIGRDALIRYLIPLAKS